MTFCPFEGQIVSCIHPLAESGSWSFWLQKFQPDSSLPRALAIFFCFFVDLRTRAQGLGTQAFASSESFVAGSPLESCTIEDFSYFLLRSYKFVMNLKRCGFYLITYGYATAENFQDIKSLSLPKRENQRLPNILIQSREFLVVYLFVFIL